MVHRDGVHGPDRRAVRHVSVGRYGCAFHAWHTHPRGQTIWVTEGICLCQAEGGPIDVIRPGDRVVFAPGEKHWHGATPNRLMTHIAMHLADESGSTVTWGEPVTDEQYAQAPDVGS